MLKIQSKSEKFLLLVAIVLLAVLGFTVFSQKPADIKVASAESEQRSGDSEGSKASENSNDGKSEESDEEDSEDSEQSVASEPSEPSESSIDSGMSEASVESQNNLNATTVSETSLSEDSASKTAQEASEASEASEKKVLTVKAEIEGYDKIVEIDGNTAIVTKNEKLFFLIPVEIESTVTLDEAGEIVIDEKKSLWAWFLSILSA